MSELMPYPNGTSGAGSPPTHQYGQQCSCVITLSERDGAWIRVIGELDLVAAPALARALAEAQESCRLMILDLRELTFMDSSGIHVLIDADARVRRAGGKLILVRGPAQVHRLLELVGLADRLEMIDIPVPEDADRGIAAGAREGVARGRSRRAD